MAEHSSEQILRPFLLAAAAGGLLVGLAAWLGGHPGWADLALIAGTVPVLTALVVEIVTSLRRGDVGLDIVAAISMTAALIFAEYLAAGVVALMYAGGQYLESFAAARAEREMTALLSRLPRTTMRHRNGALEEIPLDAVAIGDRLLVRRGDVTPVDGRVASALAILDQSALTGEAVPVRLAAGDAVMSGSTNAGEAFDLEASHLAKDSTYAGIIRLVEAAQRSKAPMVRLADRFALVFLALTLALAAAAWLLTGDPVRAVAVLVVATPCPLILAVPVALVAGLSRAAKQGILIKGGAALETLARVRAMIVDKTGTLTDGRAKLVATHPASAMAPDELLRLGASLEQASKHPMAQTLVADARQRGLCLSVPSEVVEAPGEGLVGWVDRRPVVVGGIGFVAGKLGVPIAADAGAAGATLVAVAVDGALAGTLVLADALRAGTAELLMALRAVGIDRIVVATGDRRSVALAVTAELGLDALHADLGPDQKIAVVAEERRHGPVMMIGDGVNDAPALAAADLGVAMGARGSAASAEAADVVLLVDHLDRILPALQIAKRSRYIALQSVYVGLGLSLAGMIAASLGYLTPVQGALLQEVIDVAVILNALRALGGAAAAPG